MHLEPSDYGAHGILKHTITNACEDIGNGVEFTETDLTCLEEVRDFIMDEAHKAGTVRGSPWPSAVQVECWD